ncbi:MAG: PhnD/SsuA/transferrin family substrate-binding protein [Variovorax sp.]|nr:PhnD/SsuA/transferrin family substrate-binding protein [Variovorax sp.]
MTLNFLIAPDFAPDRFAGWHMLNTALQRRSGIHLHLLTPAGAQEQARLIAEGSVDLIYANPFDAASLIRESGFVAFARPKNHSDEMVIATAAQSSMERLEDLRPGCRIALTDNRDVKLIGLRLLEAADLKELDVHWVQTDAYQVTARKVIAGEVEAGFFLADSYHSLSRLTHARLRPLIESAIHDISHVLIASPRMAQALGGVADALLSLGADEESRSVLDALGLPEGFERMTAEDAEFMVDLMDTLLD